jgi:hypothetical protein
MTDNVNKATLILVVVLIIVGLNTAITSYESNVTLKNDLDGLIQSQQKLLASNYLAASSNNLLIQNQKQFIPAIPTIHTTLAHVDSTLNQTAPILFKLGQIEAYYAQMHNQTTDNEFAFHNQQQQQQQQQFHRHVVQ